MGVTGFYFQHSTPVGGGVSVSQYFPPFGKSKALPSPPASSSSSHHLHLHRVTVKIVQNFHAPFRNSALSPRTLANKAINRSIVYGRSYAEEIRSTFAQEHPFGLLELK